MDRDGPLPTLAPLPPSDPHALRRWGRAIAALRPAAWPAVVIGATFAILTWIGWLRWAEIMVDFGREVYLPWQICAGKVLYQDLASYNGPFSPYFNAVMFHLFGTSIRTLILVNLALLLVTTGLLFHLLRGFAGRWTATAACVFFLAVFGFGHNLRLGNFNYVCPYAHEMTHGMLFSLVSLAFLWRYVRSGRVRAVLMSGVATGVVGLTKPELFVACLVAILVGLAGTWALGRRPGGVKTGLALCAGIAAPLLVAFLLFLTAMPARTAATSVLGGWPAVLNRSLRLIPFYAVGIGQSEGGANALRGLVWAALIASGGLLVWGIGHVVRRRGWPARPFAWLTGLLAFAALSRFLLPTLWIGVARPLPIVLVAVCGVTVAGVADRRRDPTKRRKSLLMLCLAAFGLVTLAKIVFTVYLGHYGFVLAMPGAMVSFVWLVEELPKRADAWGSSASVVRAGGVALALFVLVTHAGTSIISLREKSAPIGAGSDRLMALPAVAQETAMVLGLLESSAPRGASLAVLPEGALLNYLTRRPSSVPYSTLMPAEMAVYGDRAVFETFCAHPPSQVLLAPRPGSLLGVGRFGADYGQALFNWIEANYRVVAYSRTDSGRQLPFPFVLLSRPAAAR